MALTKTVAGEVNQILCMDGTTAIKDAIHNLAFTMTGGVGNTWPGDSSNFLPILGAQAPVIAQATDNLLPDSAASFEDGTTGGWVAEQGAASIGNSADWASHGIHSLKITDPTLNTYEGASLDIAGYTGWAEYTASIRIKNGPTAQELYIYLYGDATSYTTSTPMPTAFAANEEKTITVTKTFAGDGVSSLHISANNTHPANCYFYIDAIQLETGAVQTPFCLHDPLHRHASTMSIPTATIGLTAGQPLTIMCVVNTPWPGNDGVEHAFFGPPATAGNYLYLVKTAANRMEFANGNKIALSAALNGTNFAANSNHVVIATRTGGTSQIFVDGVAGAVMTGATPETTLDANLYFGTWSSGLSPINGAILAAMWGRVLT